MCVHSVSASRYYISCLSVFVSLVVVTGLQTFPRIVTFPDRRFPEKYCVSEFFVGKTNDGFFSELTAYTAKRYK